MRMIGVIDLAGGRAVHARLGRRAEYQPVGSTRLVPAAAAGDAQVLARAYQQVGVEEIYLADLDAIGGLPPAAALIGAIATLGLPLWVDAGITGAGAARAILDAGASGVIVGSETLPSWAALDAIVGEVGGRRSRFGIDLRGGTPLGNVGTEPGAMAAQAATAGVAACVLLELARVGGAGGPDLALVRAVRAAAPDVELLVGGGVRNQQDLDALNELGCTGVLMATALHEGTVALAAAK